MDDETDRIAPRRLTRRSSDRVIAGIASGLADYTGLDPVIFRIGFIALTIAGGTGLLLYGLAWLVIPEENETEPIGRSLLERLKRPRWLAAVLLGAGALIALNEFGNTHNVGPWMWVVVLIGVGYVLLRDEPGEPTERVPDAAASSTGDSSVPDPAPGELPAAAKRTPRARRSRSPLALMTIGIALQAAAIASALSTTDALELDLGQYVALVLTILGIGLIVGASWGRARWLVLVGLIVIPVMLVASMIHVPLRGTIGDNYVEARGQISDDYEILLGSLFLDLTNYRFGATPTEVDVSFVVGNLDVYVPAGVEVEVNGSVDVGGVDIFGDDSEGRGLELDGTYRRDGLTEGTLVLNVRGGVGSVETGWVLWKDKEIRRQERERKERAEGRRQDG